MPKYNVTGTVTGAKYLGVFEADSPEAAVEKALESNAARVTLCHQCCVECEDPEIQEGEAEAI